MQFVDLIIFFEPIEALQVSHFSTLREAWRDEYPETAELPPLRPHNRDGDEASIFPITQAWPFPYLMYSSGDGRSSIGFQTDRFTRSWGFADDVNDYPGFEKLAADLEGRLGQFTEAVLHETGQQVVLTGAECIYRNLIESVSGEELCLGVLTGWSGVAAPESFETQYAGVRMHFCTDEDMDSCSVTLSVDVDSDGNVLVLDSERDLNEGEDLDLGGLRVAHDQLIRKFVQYTSEAMHNEWERV